MSVGVTVYLDKRQVLKNGKYRVKLRVRYNEQYGYRKLLIDSLVVEKSQKEFEDIMNPKARGSNKHLQDDFNLAKSKLEKIIKDIKVFSFEALKKATDLKGRGTLTLEAAFADKMAKAETYGTKKGYNTALNSLMAFGLHKKTITVGSVEKWIKFMATSGIVLPNGKSKKNSINTQSIYLRKLKCILNEYDLTDEDVFGKKGIEIPKSYPKQGRKALEIEEIRALRAEEANNKLEQEAKDIWSFSYLCSGMNVVDIIELTWKQVDFDRMELIFVRRKTRNTKKGDNNEIVIQLLDEAKEIIDREGVKGSKYVFKYLKGGEDDKTFYRIKDNLLSRVNDNIRKVAKRAGIDTEFMTSYSARHSYGTVLKRGGEDISLISEQLGHSSIETTKTYLGTHKAEKVRKAANKLL